jgi:hypothetical protein
MVSTLICYKLTRTLIARCGVWFVSLFVSSEKCAQVEVRVRGFREIPCSSLRGDHKTQPEASRITKQIHHAVSVCGMCVFYGYV